MIDITDKRGLEVLFSKDFGSPYFPILADLYLQERDYRRAKLVCETGLQQSPSNDCGWMVLAQVAIIEEKSTIAEKCLKKAVQSNPANFNALRMLIRLEFILNRSPKTIKQYIKHILQYLPNDGECQVWLTNIVDDSKDLAGKSKRTISKAASGKGSHNKSGVKKTSKNDLDYKVEESMATFTMLQVLKSQKHYHQALAVLKMLSSKNINPERIKEEEKEILSLLSTDAKA